MLMFIQIALLDSWVPLPFADKRVMPHLVRPLPPFFAAKVRLAYGRRAFFLRVHTSRTRPYLLLLIRTKHSEPMP